MKEVFRKLLLRDVYSRLYATPLAMRKITLLGEKRDFGTFLSLIGKIDWEKGFDYLFRFSLSTKNIEHKSMSLSMFS